MNRSYLLLLLLVLVFPLPASSQLVINELMQSNIDCIMDDLNEFPDSWVELYNNGQTAESLSNYSIGPTADAASSWKLPNQQIGPGQRVLVFCDKEAQSKHADFKLESGNDCSVYLFFKGGLVDKVEGLAKQPAPNVAYGRKTDGGNEWGYQEIPTPNSANCGKVCQEILGDPVFNQKGLVKTDNASFQLAITLPDDCPANTVIKITTDGSEPKETSTTYTTPLTINKTTTVRAKLFCEGYLSNRATTHSYIFHPRALTLPVISIVTDHKYFYDNKIGIYVNGSYQSGKKNYQFDWRRPVNIEYFAGKNTESEINQLCETRIQGGASRDSKYKSLVMYANKRFGKKRLKYEFFPDQKPGMTDFKSVILRNAGNDFDYLYMRDAIIQRTMAKHTDLDWQAWRPCIIYLNGTYMGMLNIRERSTGDNIYSNYDGLEDIDMIENWNQLKEGDTNNWEAFKQFYAEHGHTLEEYERWIDWREFINLMVMNLFYNNQDFPGNNIVMWRPRVDNGVWRFVAKDTDFGLGLYGSSSSYNSIEWLYDPNYDYDRNWANQYEHTRLFRRMMEIEEFKQEFIDRAAIYMGDFMNLEGTSELWDPMVAEIQAEYPYHRKLINQWWPNYTEELNNARNWLKTRPNYFYTHLANYYKLGTPVPLQMNLEAAPEDLQAVTISMNGIKLSKSRFDGKYFANRMLHITSAPRNGRQVKGWKIISIYSNGTTTDDVAGSSIDFEMPSCQKVIFMAQFEDETGIEDLSSPTFKWHKDGGQLTLEGVAAGMAVRIYDANGILLKTFIADGGTLQAQVGQRRMLIVKIGQEVLKIK